jgi:hypothetical protein
MYSMLMGSKPMSLAATASIATWSAEASITFFTTGNIVRVRGPLPAVVPSMTAKIPGWSSRWMASRSTSVRWIQECV